MHCENSENGLGIRFDESSPYGRHQLTDRQIWLHNGFQEYPEYSKHTCEPETYFPFTVSLGINFETGHLDIAIERDSVSSDEVFVLVPFVARGSRWQKLKNQDIYTLTNEHPRRPLDMSDHFITSLPVKIVNGDSVNTHLISADYRLENYGNGYNSRGIVVSSWIE